MNLNEYINKTVKNPLGALYGALLGFVAFSAAVPMCTAGMYDAALVDLVMAVWLIILLFRKVSANNCQSTSWQEKLIAWLMLPSTIILALLPTHNLAGSLTTALAFAMLICAVVLYFSGTNIALYSVVAAVWCCVFMPYHEELMLLLSFPLRLSATVLSGVILNIFGLDIVYTGTSLTLPGMNIAITDACSGIKQLDAFILIAFATAQIMHQKTGWKILHMAFIIPAIIIGNTLRIVLTIVFYRIWGEVVLQNLWHTALGYVQIILAVLIFIGIGMIFAAVNKETTESGS